MAVRIVQLGTPMSPHEGVRLGVVRRPPRGVKKSEYASRGFFDEWLPELAPSAPLVKWYHEEHPISDERWAKYRKMYAREMDAPEKRRLLAVLARLSQQADFSIGCYCERADRCHRSLLGGMLRDHGAVVIDDEAVSPGR
jgi:uncharacterized protein YeaO (DUF488 family)